MVPDGLAWPMRAACGLLCRAMVFTPENRPTVLTALQWSGQRVRAHEPATPQSKRLDYNIVATALSNTPIEPPSGRAGAISRQATGRSRPATRCDCKKFRVKGAWGAHNDVPEARGRPFSLRSECLEP
jgi:hypothetical protein